MRNSKSTGKKNSNTSVKTKQSNLTTLDGKSLEDDALDATEETEDDQETEEFGQAPEDPFSPAKLAADAEYEAEQALEGDAGVEIADTDDGISEYDFAPMEQQMNFGDEAETTDTTSESYQDIEEETGDNELEIRDNDKEADELNGGTYGDNDDEDKFIDHEEEPDNAGDLGEVHIIQNPDDLDLSDTDNYDEVIYSKLSKIDRYKVEFALWSNCTHKTPAINKLIRCLSYMIFHSQLANNYVTNPELQDNVAYGEANLHESYEAVYGVPLR
jgi:hypothetical protein